MHYLTPEQVLFIHARLIAETCWEHGVRDLGLLQSAGSRPMATFDGVELYQDVHKKAAALMESLINDHPFVDGNKRTGIASAAMFLRINGNSLEMSSAKMESFVLAVASGRQSLESIAEWLRRYSKAVE